MFKIKTLNKIAYIGLEQFKEGYELVEDDKNIDAYLVRSFKMHDMSFDRRLVAIGRAGAGVNNIPIEKCSENGVVVFNTPGANANAVKELVIAGLLMSSRNVVQGIDWAKGLTEDVAKTVEKGKSQFAGQEIKGKKLGVIGLGAIGVMVANAATSLGMKVKGYDPFISVKSAWGLSAKVERREDIKELLRECDYISVHIPLTDSTKEMFDEGIFSLMKKGVKLLNFSRGGLVNNEDLLKAIEKGIVDHYVTDFPEEALINKKNVICIPHLGASTNESEENCAVMVGEQIKDYLENGNISNSVNYPACDMGRCKTECRITVNHQNIPSMVGKITNLLAEDNINISVMNNRSKNNWAYTVLDVESKIGEALKEKLENITGVVRVRLLQ